jgi:release factor glutamine methyltransferase
MRLLDVLNSTTDFFKKKGVPSPKLQAEFLLSKTLQMPRLHLYLQFERILGPEELDVLRPLVKRRSQREPLQYILGQVDFAGLELEVSPAVLIPRPETELLIEKLQTRFPSGPGGTVYDVGTGSGAIALSLARIWPENRIIGIDASPDALAMAHQNQQRHPGLRVEWREGNLLSGQTETAALVVANLPYLTQAEMDELEPEVRQEPPQALLGGTDGLDLIRLLIPQAASLSPEIALEIGIAQGPATATLLQNSGYQKTSVETDLLDHPRFVFGSR